MRQALLALAFCLCALPASAQPDMFFGNGQPYSFQETDTDKRFQRTRLHQALMQGTDDPNCAQLVGGLLTLLGEAAPYLHKRDENFFLDPALVQALQQQMSNKRFPAASYFVSMVRRVMLDKKLPPEWLQTATAVAPASPTLDVGKLRFLSDGPQPIDSFLFNLSALMGRYDVEVKQANATVAAQAESDFREGYKDHDVAFGGLELLDLTVDKPKAKPRKRRGASAEPEEPPTVIARLAYFPPDPNAGELNIFGTPKKRAQVLITARLAEKQYLDLGRVPKGTRLLARGRFWGYKKGLSELELREVLLFQDRDWSQGALIVNPAAVAACPLAVNDLTGIAPKQPGGFSK